MPDALFLIAGDDCGRAVFVSSGVEGYLEETAVFFHYLVDDSLRGDGFGAVSNFSVAKVGRGVRLGEIADFAGGELGVDKGGDGFFIVQAQGNLWAFALDTQRVPLPRFDFAAVADRLLFLSVDGFFEEKPSAEGVNADGIVVLWVLPAEKDAGGLRLFALQNFEADGELKVFETFFGIEEHRETILGRNPGQLADDVFAVGLWRQGGNLRHGRGHAVGKNAPLCRRAFAGKFRLENPVRPVQSGSRMFQRNHRAAERKANSKKRAEARKGSSHSRMITKSKGETEGILRYFAFAERGKHGRVRSGMENKFSLSKAGVSLK